MRSDGQTLQDRVFETLLGDILSGAIAVGAPLPPERQLSVALGVSRTTITRALDRLEADGWISREQGRGTFVRDHPAPKGATIALAAAVPAHPSLFACLTGLASVVNAANGQLRLLGSFEGFGSERDMIDRARRDGAEGLIVYPGLDPSAASIYRALHDEGFPFVLIDRYYRDLDCARVTYNDVETAEAICGALFDQGCRRIAVVPHREYAVTSVENRIEGARRAASSRNLGVDAITIWRDVYAEFSPSQPHYEAQTARLKPLAKRFKSDSVDGLFAINGDVAERLARDIEYLGSSVDVDALNICACVHQPIDGPRGKPILMAQENSVALGRTAGEILMGLLNEPDGRAPISLKVEMKILKFGQSNTT